MGSKIYVEHAERRSDWTAEIADNLSREETTTEINQFTLSRFGGTKEIGPLENWMLTRIPSGEAIWGSRSKKDRLLKNQ